MGLKISEEWFANCGGCEVTLLDIGEPLLDLLPQLEFVHIPVLADNKYFGQTGEKDKLELPEADVGLISGSIRNDEHKEIAIEMREKCKTLIALGSCACFGGIPALANQWQLQDLYDKVYRDSVSTDSADTPDQDIPPLTDRVYAIDDVVGLFFQKGGPRRIPTAAQQMKKIGYFQVVSERIGNPCKQVDFFSIHRRRYIRTTHKKGRFRAGKQLPEIPRCRILHK